MSKNTVNILLFLIAFAMICFAGHCIQIWLSKLFKKKHKSTKKHSDEFTRDMLVVLNVSHPLAAQSQEVCEATRRCVDAVIDGREQLDLQKLFALRFCMNFGFMQTNEESKYRNEESFNKDKERVTRFGIIYDDMSKIYTKLKVQCPGCGRSLKGATEAMIGDAAVCPKCKAEFEIKQEDNKVKNE